MTTYYQITPYVIGVAGDGFTEIVCQEHALNFAEDNSLVWDSSLGYTEDRGDQVYAYADTYGEIESDTPQSCTACEIDGKHSTWLGVGLTKDGVEYLTDPTNNFPADVIKFYLGGN